MPLRSERTERGCAAIFLPALLLFVIALLVAVYFAHAALSYGQSPSDVLHPCPSDSYGESTRVHGRCPLDDPSPSTTHERKGPR